MPGPDFWKGPVHSGKNLRGETRFGFSKNPTGEFLKSRAMKEGVDFARTPSSPIKKYNMKLYSYSESTIFL